MFAGKISFFPAKIRQKEIALFKAFFMNFLVFFLVILALFRLFSEIFGEFMVCPAFHRSQELFLYTYLENHKKKIWLKSHKIQFFVHYRAKFLPDFCRQRAIKTGKFADCRQKEKTGKTLIPSHDFHGTMHVFEKKMK